MQNALYTGSLATADGPRDALCQYITGEIYKTDNETSCHLHVFTCMSVEILSTAAQL